MADVEIDQRSYLPRGLRGAEYEYSDDSDNVSGDPDNSLVEVDPTDDPYSDVPTDDTTLYEETTKNLLQPPTGMTILSQVVRFDASGNHVIDAVIGFTDATNFSTYNVRVTKL